MKQSLRGSGGGLVVAPAEIYRHLWALSLTVSCVVSSSLNIRLVSLSLDAILWRSGLLSFCVCFLILAHMVVLILWVCFLYFERWLRILLLKKVCIIFQGQIRRGSFPEWWQSANVTAIPNCVPSPDKENYSPISITPILTKVYEKLVSQLVSGLRS